MNTRSIVFENFRNLGIDSHKANNLSNRLYLGSIDDGHIGGLIILLGGNNDGKSNVLKGLKQFHDNKLEKIDTPDFIGYEDKKPKITLEYTIRQPTKILEIENIKSMQDNTQQSKKSKIFEGKTFGIVLRSKVVEDYEHRQEDREIGNSKDCRQYWQDILDSSAIYILQRQDNDKLPELRLISKEYNHICICSIKADNRITNSLSCVVVRYDFRYGIEQEIQKDMEYAIKLDCKFQVILEDSKAPKNCDDASILRDFLKDEFEARTYNSNDTKAISPSMPRKDSLQFSATLELANKDTQEACYTTNLPKDIDIIHECFGIPFHPNIILYTESALKDSDLESNGEKLEESIFFKTLFKILEEDIQQIKNALKSTPRERKSRERTLETKCEHINKRFNELYCLNDAVYRFSIRLEENKIAFCMEKNDEAIGLSQQSIGFQKFFNLFFNFLYDDAITKGDIVLIDEVDAHLSIPAQKELRKFLKEYGQKNGIIFIVSTHSPYMIDIAHLDEVRIIKSLNSLDSNLKGSLVINDFSMRSYGDSDTLNDIKKALGGNIDFDSDKVIFVEGIIDSNILNAYNTLYAENNDSIKLIFLPISGLGSKDSETESKELHFSEEQRQKAHSLITLAKNMRIHPILLVDNDKAGKAMKEGVEKDPNLKKALSVITLKEAFEDGDSLKNGFKSLQIHSIESLLSKEDREQFGFEDCKENKEASIISGIFKNTNNLKERLSQESKKNLDELFKYIIGFKAMDI